MYLHQAWIARPNTSRRPPDASPVRGARYHPAMGARVVPKTQLRDRIREELAHLLFQDVVITHRGRPMAVIVHIDRWNHLQEQIEQLEAAVELFDRDLAAEAVGLIPIPMPRSTGPLYR